MISRRNDLCLRQLCTPLEVGKETHRADKSFKKCMCIITAKLLLLAILMNRFLESLKCSLKYSFLVSKNLMRLS